VKHHCNLQPQKTKGFALKQSDGKLCLDKTHAYYYQIQTQLFVCEVEYTDFCVCTFATDNQDNHSDCGIQIERINKNPEFWNECIGKASHFFITCILPEL